MGTAEEKAHFTSQRCLGGELKALKSGREVEICRLAYRKTTPYLIICGHSRAVSIRKSYHNDAWHPARKRQNEAIRNLLRSSNPGDEMTSAKLG